MKRVVALTLIITIVFWAVISVPLIASAETLSGTYYPVSDKLYIYSVGTGRITKATRTKNYLTFTPAVTGSGWSYRNINYYYTNDVSAATGVRYDINNCYFSVFVDYPTFTLPEHYGDNVFKFSTQVLSYGSRVPSCSLMATYGEYSDAGAISTVNVATKIGTYYYNDQTYGSYSYDLYQLDVLVSIDDIPTTYYGADITGVISDWPIQNYFFQTRTYHYLWPNYTIDKSKGGLDYSTSNSQGYYNIYRLPYKSVNMDFEYSANYEAAAYKMQKEINESIKAAGQQVSDTIKDVYGELDPEVIDHFNDVINDNNSAAESAADIENSFFNAADSAVDGLEAFSAPPEVLQAAEAYSGISDSLWGSPFVIFAIALVGGLALLSFLITGKVR